MITTVRVFALQSLLALALLLLGAPAKADDFSSYTTSTSFSLPGATGAFDSLPDGRVIAAIGNDIYRETAPGSRSFTDLGPLPNADLSGFGAAFLRVSPDGTMIAIGNNGGSSFGNYQVGVFALANLTGQWFAASHYDGAWIDNRYIALTAGSLSDPVSVVTALDRLSLTPTNPVNRTIIGNINGASGGVALDSAGNLYTGNGFTYGGPSQTGYIYAFPSSLYTPALAGGPPANFETQGIPIVDLLSAGTLAFDAQGNLLVGGGEFGSSGDNNYFALVHAPAITAALAGGGLINTSAGAGNVRKFDPDPSDGTFYALNANRARKEIYATSFGESTVFTLKASSSVAAPIPWWSVGLAAAALGLLGLASMRRRFAAEGVVAGQRACA